MTAHVAPRAGMWSRLAAAISTLILMPVMAAQKATPAVQTVSLQGKVQDSVGLALADATVELRHGAEVVVAKTDAQGNFVVSAAPGSYELVAAKASLRSLETIQLITGKQGTAKVITLTPGPNATTVTMGVVSLTPLKVAGERSLPKAVPVSLAAPKPR